jgi:hypothetical protein
MMMENKGERTTMHINHAGRVDDLLLIWSAGTLYMRTLCVIL